MYLDYRDQGLKVVALDPDSTDAENIGWLTEYVAWLDVDYPVGIETTDNYSEIEGVFDGANPYPVDIIVDRQGTIRYIAREYDYLAMELMVQELLAEP